MGGRGAGVVIYIFQYLYCIFSLLYILLIVYLWVLKIILVYLRLFLDLY